MSLNGHLIYSVCFFCLFCFVFAIAF
uniref:Uncharacterized protein n=1 Tax=Anguilla anguilla TaxID=7936 RepID=A0A0E9TRI6_ANGAN